MKSSILLLVCVVLSSFGTQINSTETATGDKLEKQPEFYVLEWKPGTILKKQKTQLFIEVDSIGQHNIDVFEDKNGQPVLFGSDISTPVCADGECKLMHIKLYWTLLGEYAGFDRYPDLPLTKHDHDEFTTPDYLKLHRLLIDDNSILKHRTIDRLVEKPKLREVNGVDAISGATIAEVKESVVSGALYSCYVAWHLAHGEIRRKIKAYTIENLNENILVDMLRSDNPDYQLCALENLSPAMYEVHYKRIAEIFLDGIPLVRNLIVKSLPDRIWNSPGLSQPFWHALPKIDVGSRSLLLEHLQFATPGVLEKVSENLDVLTKNQLKIFLESLSDLKFSPRL
ncbi:MAG: hypothetical protein GY931_17535, partial [Maribacter sp.]|nr:hypothetical protein [Maribacter sp.]